MFQLYRKQLSHIAPMRVSQVFQLLLCSALPQLAYESLVLASRLLIRILTASFSLYTKYRLEEINTSAIHNRQDYIQNFINLPNHNSPCAEDSATIKYFVYIFVGIPRVVEGDGRQKGLLSPYR